MAKSIRSHKKKHFRSIKRKNVFEPLYIDRIERLSLRLKNLSNKDNDNLDEMAVDNDQENITDRAEDMYIDDIPVSSMNKKNNGADVSTASSRVSLKKKIYRKKFYKKRSFGTIFSEKKQKKKKKR